MPYSMNIGGKDQSGAPNLFFDLKNNKLSQKGSKSTVFKVTSTQLPAMQGIAVTDLLLTHNNKGEPHWHPNAGELDYIISGEVVTSVVDPYTLQLLQYHVKPGQVVFIPMGWWHWITPISEKAHLLVIYNNDNPKTVKSSDVLQLIPPDALKPEHGLPRYFLW
ncbi:cupin domain-containing protein [Aneurinibacillus aneurinilyticus]|uniref:cupin domain-containing protein n=1 Tax=Aneurinibacillus aneurinilyticus TaxID=1391 RepID=UPI0023EFB71B|nr:cupin domain-containing protein [Aneurinibacillus aneurinilyticus]